MMDALLDLRRQQVELRDYEQTPLHQVRLWSEIERGKPLFESIVVFESTPRTVHYGPKAESGRIGVFNIKARATIL